MKKILEKPQKSLITNAKVTQILVFMTRLLYSGLFQQFTSKKLHKVFVVGSPRRGRRVEGPALLSNTMQVGRRPTQLGALLIVLKVPRRGTSS